MLKTIIDFLMPNRAKRLAELAATQARLNAKYSSGQRKSIIFWNGVADIKELANDIKTLNDIIECKINRDHIRRGLCFQIRTKMANVEFLKYYKYWSGNLGHVIKLNYLTGDCTDQYHSEKNGYYKEDQVAYYQARIELANHWLSILTPIYQDVLLYKGSR
ncbi:hypothetical protein Aeh1ORF046c [Aeromonas phage Aeh1]|uniref:Uncharacterized protein n=1 Tax=Aeromonas phage Aeh1 TaxID=2880362 RepID=Q76Z41_9CAUD|nr:hypothetical protein Aeh1p050 [Aeromonas phage Aeh1]AAQ17705.1 hypothetical protein Aeh1ORF046c [Aeromonas phage Aeh1]